MYSAKGSPISEFFHLGHFLKIGSKLVSEIKQPLANQVSIFEAWVFQYRAFESIDLLIENDF